MEIENKTLVDKKLFVSYNQTYMKRNVAFIISNIVFLLLSIAIMILWAKAISSGVHVGLYTFYIIILLALVLFRIYRIIFAPAKNFKRSALRDAVITYKFYDDKLSTETRTETINSSGERLYSAIQKVIETSDAIYIFIEKAQAFLVSKGGFSSESDCNEVCAKLSSILGKKYIKTK